MEEVEGGAVIEIPGSDLLFIADRAFTGERPWLLPGDMGLPLLVGESEDSEEFEVDLCEEVAPPLLPLPPPTDLVTASAASVGPPPPLGLPRLAGWGTKITEIQLSSESSDVSL